MTTSRRDAILSAINKEGQPDFRGIMQAIKAEATETGGSKSKNDCSEELRTRMEGVMKRTRWVPTKAPLRLPSS